MVAHKGATVTSQVQRHETITVQAISVYHGECQSMRNRQWLVWSTLIVAVSFASYCYGALQQSKHALAATSGAIPGTAATTSTKTRAGSTLRIHTASVENSNSVQFQVGKTQSLAQWEGLTAPSSTSTPPALTPGSGGVILNPGQLAQALSHGPLPSTLAGLLQSLGIPASVVHQQTDGNPRSELAQLGHLQLPPQMAQQLSELQQWYVTGKGHDGFPTKSGHRHG